MKTTILQCLICGQIVAGNNPDNLKKICLPCCRRIKEDNPDTPFITLTADLPMEVIPCPSREGKTPEQCTYKIKEETENC